MKLFTFIALSASAATISSIAIAQTATGQNFASNKSTAISAQLSQLNDVIKILQTELNSAKARIKTLEDKPNDVPSGTVAAFKLETCPESWSDYNEAAGRSIIGTGEYTEHSPLDTNEFGGNATMYKYTYGLGYRSGRVHRHLTYSMLPSHQHVVPFGENAGHSGYSPRWGYAKDIPPYSNDASAYINQNGTKGHDNDNEWMMTSPFGGISAIPANAKNAFSSHLKIKYTTNHPIAMNIPAHPSEYKVYGEQTDVFGNKYYKQFLSTMNPYIALKYCKKN